MPIQVSTASWVLNGLRACSCAHAAARMQLCHAAVRIQLCMRLCACGCAHAAVRMRLCAWSCAHAAVRMQLLCACSCAHAAVPMQLCPCSCAHAAVRMQLWKCSSRRPTRSSCHRECQGTTPSAAQQRRQRQKPESRYQTTAAPKTGTESSCRFGLEITSPVSARGRECSRAIGARLPIPSRFASDGVHTFALALGGADLQTQFLL